MMRAWGNRPDTLVVDEPFYAFYLKVTGKEHPGADEVMATGETDWRKVVERLTGPIPEGKCEVIASYIKKQGGPTLEDLGFVQQEEIFDWVRARTSATPSVVDARDVLENPTQILGLLCDAVGVAFNESMLSWPSGLRETDGIWAKHWYGEVAGSTSFRSYRPKHNEVPGRFREIYERCQECYERLYEYRLH